MKDGSTLILFKNDKKEEVFLVFRSDFPIWGITGGGIEKGETPKEAAIREAEEETGFKVKLIKKVGIYKSNDHTSHLYEGRVVSGTFKPEYLGCKGRWFKVNKLPSDITKRGREKVIDCLKSQKGIFIKSNPPLCFWDNIHLLFLHPIGFIKYLVTRICMQ